MSMNSVETTVVETRVFRYSRNKISLKVHCELVNTVLEYLPRR